MTVVYITSDQPGAGKTCLAATLLRLLRDRVRAVGYVKALSETPTADSDTTFIQDAVLPGLKTVATPAFALPEASLIPPAAVAQRVSQAVQPLIRDTEALVVEGPSLMSPLGDLSALSALLAQSLDATVLMVIGHKPDLDESQIVQAVRGFGSRPVGLLVNNVGRYRVQELRQKVAQWALAPNVRVLGTLPEDRLMLAVTVGQVAEHLDSQWVMGREKAGNLVEHFLIGGNIMDSGSDYFGRSDRAAVIVRGNRPDIQMAALTALTTCLILTGGHQPIEYVYHEVEQLEVPLLVVRGDTFVTIEALSGVLDRATPYHQQKLDRFRQLLEQHAGIQGFTQLAP